MKIARLIGLVFGVLVAVLLAFSGSFIYQNFPWNSIGDIMTVSETLEKQKPDAPKYLKETGIVIFSSLYGTGSHLDTYILWSIGHIKDEMGYKHVLTILRNINNFEQVQSVISRLENEGVKRIIVLPLFMSADDQELQILSYMLDTKETGIAKLRLINARTIKHSRRIFLMDPVPVPLGAILMTVETEKMLNEQIEKSIEKGLEYFGIKRKISAE